MKLALLTRRLKTRSQSFSLRFATTIPKRKPFAQVQPSDFEYFRSILLEKGVITDAETLKQYNVDWLKKYTGTSQIVLKPQTTHQVSQILKYCNQRNLAVCPQGGITGLVGGSVPVYDEVIINMSRMNNVVDFQPTSGIITVEAGVILTQMENFLNEKGYCAPLDLGAKGSCHIGGNASTNAGGIRLLRYGSLHGNILGLEVVLASGEILDSLTTMRKDNTGYDLKQLFIGAEGTLGIITKISILCPPLSSSTNVALLGTNDFQKAQQLLVVAKKLLGEVLSAYEFWDNHCMELLMEHFKPDLKEPFQNRYKFYILVETSGSNKDHDQEKITKFLESATSENLVQDGLSADSEREQKAIWKLRESITTALLTKGKPYKYDISVPISQMYDLVEQVQKNFSDSPEVFVCGYGHMGDGNLHLNIVAPEFSDTVLNKIEPFVYEYAAKYKGSVSAEHGIGVMKPSVLHYSKSPELIQIMRQIKKVMDPNGILNPYKVLPEQE